MEKGNSGNKQKSSAVTLKDVADRCGVCKQTVSRALRGDFENVGRDTADRIVKLAEEMGYDPSLNHSARKLAFMRMGQGIPNQVIALLFPHDFYMFSYFNSMFRGVLEATAEAQYGLLTTYYRSSSEFELPPSFRRGEVDGFIINPWGEETEERINQLLPDRLNTSCPVICIITPIPGCAAVLTDDLSGGYAAAAHLLDLGHEHIVHFCGNNEIYPIAQRLKGYRQAFIDRRLDPDTHLHYFQWDSSIRLEEGIIDFLEQRPKITAVLAKNDLIATHVIHLLGKRGMQIPGDISVVGFDDAEPVYDEDRNNILTTVRLPLVEVGATAATVLMRRSASGANLTERIVLPTELVVRRSTAPPRVSSRASMYAPMNL